MKNVLGRPVSGENFNTTELNFCTLLHTTAGRSVGSCWMSTGHTVNSVEVFSLVEVIEERWTLPPCLAT
jgi:hypothetical protein